MDFRRQNRIADKVNSCFAELSTVRKQNERLIEENERLHAELELITDDDESEQSLLDRIDRLITLILKEEDEINVTTLQQAHAALVRKLWELGKK